MRSTALGHAIWHAEPAGLRLHLDPRLGPTHHDGVFTVTPPRAVDVAALRPNVMVASHRYPDHFDVGSLLTLARRYPDAVVLTADALVGRISQRLGFRHVSLLPDHQALSLVGVQVLTTASHCKVDEWAIVLATGVGTVWDQIDTVLGRPLPRGRLRTVDRRVVAWEGSLVRPRLPQFFPYLTLPYDTAAERWIEHQLQALGC
jgi:hypothetical protein